MPAAAARNAVVADSAVAGAAAEVRGAGGAIGAVVAAYAPGGALGTAHHDDDVIAGIWSDGDEQRVLRALGSENFVPLL